MPGRSAIPIGMVVRDVLRCLGASCVWHRYLLRRFHVRVHSVMEDNAALLARVFAEGVHIGVGFAVCEPVHALTQALTKQPLSQMKA